GARGIIQFMDSYMGNVIADVALNFDWDVLIEKGQRGKIKLQLEVERPSSPFYSGDAPAPTKAVLKVIGSAEGKVVSNMDVDVTSAANFGPQVHVDDAKATAYHEMGHA